jgi:hypothetical protein
LPDPFIDKLTEYHLFDPSVCAFTAAKLDGKEHVKKDFAKDRTTLTSDEEVLRVFNI